MWPDRNTLGIFASIIAIALLFCFVGFKVGEGYAPRVVIAWENCDG